MLAAGSFVSAAIGSASIVSAKENASPRQHQSDAGEALVESRSAWSGVPDAQYREDNRVFEQRPFRPEGHDNLSN